MPRIRRRGQPRNRGITAAQIQGEVVVLDANAEHVARRRTWESSVRASMAAER
jgi:hypothetical protein